MYKIFFELLKMDFGKVLYDMILIMKGENKGEIGKENLKAKRHKEERKC